MAAGFYQGGAGNLRLGEEFHHNRLSIMACDGAWESTGDRYAPLWNRRRIMATVTRLLYNTDRVSVEGLLSHTFPSSGRRRPTAQAGRRTSAAVKVALEYGGERG